MSNYENIKEDLTRKFLELKMWINGAITDEEIISSENHIEENNSKINKGLYFVYVYGLYEAIIKSIVGQTIDQINNEHLKVRDCKFELYDLVFSKEYEAIHSAGRETKWKKRWDISDRLSKNDGVNISRELFPTDGRNISYSQLESLSKSFGIQTPTLPRNEVGGYIRTMVNNRNSIAHGDFLPSEIGAKYTKAEILKNYECINEVCSYLISQYEDYTDNKEFKVNV